MQPDDRLDRMMADPDTYFAECRHRAREMVERDMHREWKLEQAEGWAKLRRFLLRR